MSLLRAANTSLRRSELPRTRTLQGLKKLGSSGCEVAESMALAMFARYATSKRAEADDSTHETEDDARRRRIGELLKRRAPSGLATGSAEPTPPRSNS